MFVKSSNCVTNIIYEILQNGRQTVGKVLMNTTSEKDLTCFKHISNFTFRRNESHLDSLTFKNLL